MKKLMNNEVEETRFYFAPGQLVTLRHKELNSPIMLVTDKVSKQFKNEDGDLENYFAGMRCIWFDKNNVLQTAVFSTKDLELYK